MRSPGVFMSMGTPYRPEQFAFHERLVALLKDECDVDPGILKVHEYPSGNGLDKIRKVMSTCDGVLIVAYERSYIARGIERRRGEKERAISNAKYTTPWNHIESAMAYSLNLPIHIIAESGLVEEGLIEDKIDW
jgi:hypothetical protein